MSAPMLLSLGYLIIVLSCQNIPLGELGIRYLLQVLPNERCHEELLPARMLDTDLAGLSAGHQPAKLAIQARMIAMR